MNPFISSRNIFHSHRHTTKLFKSFVLSFSTPHPNIPPSRTQIQTRFTHTTSFTMSPASNSSDLKSNQAKAKSHGHDSSDVEGEHNEWKFRAPYLIHENLENGDGSDGEEGVDAEKNGNGKRVREDRFRVWYEGSCHCGRVQYQLGRERPLASKICHCGTW